MEEALSGNLFLATPLSHQLIYNLKYTLIKEIIKNCLIIESSKKRLSRVTLSLQPIILQKQK